MLKLSTVITASACALCAVALAATQEVAVETVDANGSMVLDAVCDLVNQNGSWRVTTPGTVPINAGGDWLTVKCAKDFDLIGRITSFNAGRPLAARRSPMSVASPAPAGNQPATKLRVMMQDATMSTRAQANRSEVQLVQKPASAVRLFVPKHDEPAPALIVNPEREPALIAALPSEPDAPTLAKPATGAAVHPEVAATAKTQYDETPKLAPTAILEPVPSAAPTAPPMVANAAPDFYDVKAVPYLNAQGRAVYADFRNFPLPRAFAIAKNGAWGWASRTADARAMALKNCERRSGVSCDIYAMDKDVVWSGAM